MSKLVDHRQLYRLPWNLADNAISWLEPTAQCNLVCDGCYRLNRVEHKDFAQTMHELDVFGRYRKSDALSIAGGDPLLYPDVLRTVAEAKRRGYKPVVNTNGLALTAELARELKSAGLMGFTFHVDSKQGRPGRWRGKNELELCELRDELAEIAASVDVSCAFNSTVYPDTLKYVPELLRWAEQRIDKVDVMVFILYRDMPVSRFRFFAGQEEVSLDAAPTPTASTTASAPSTAARSAKRGKRERDNGATVYNLDLDKNYNHYVDADDVVATIREHHPDFAPSAYLNGTEDPSSFKWLLSGRVGRPGDVLGYVGPKFMELVQSAYHLWTGKYLAYASPAVTRRSKALLLLSPLDRGVRSIARRFAKQALRHPFQALARPLYFQAVMIIQPIDVLEDGRTNMCDGCPDITVYDDKLVWSCRMDELERFGRNVRVEPRVEADVRAAAQVPVTASHAKTASATAAATASAAAVGVSSEASGAKSLT